MAPRGRPALTATKSGPSYRISEWLDKNIDSKLGGRTQTELAEKLGYERQTMISMMRKGRTRVPLEKVEQLATELGVDQSFLMLLALEQYLPGQEELLHRTFGKFVAEKDFDLVQQLKDVLPSEKIVVSEAQKRLVGKVLSSPTVATSIEQTLKTADKAAAKAKSHASA